MAARNNGAISTSEARSIVAGRKVLADIAALAEGVAALADGKKIPAPVAAKIAEAKERGN